MGMSSCRGVREHALEQLDTAKCNVRPLRIVHPRRSEGIRTTTPQTSWRFRSTGTHLDQGHARKAVTNRTIIYCWSQIVRPRRASSVAKTSARRRRVRAHVVGTRLDDRAFSLCLIHPTRTHVNWPPYPSQACKVLVFLHFIRASSGFQLRSLSSPAASSNLPMLRPVSEMQDLCP